MGGDVLQGADELVGVGAFLRGVGAHRVCGLGVQRRAPRRRPEVVVLEVCLPESRAEKVPQLGFAGAGAVAGEELAGDAGRELLSDAAHLLRGSGTTTIVMLSIVAVLIALILLMAWADSKSRKRKQQRG